MRPCGRPAGRTMFIFLFLSHSNSLTQKLCLSLSLYLPSSDGPRVRGRQSRAFGGRRPALSRSLVSACARPYTPVRRRASRRTWVRVRGGGGRCSAAVLIGSMAVGRPTFEPVRHNNTVSRHLAPAAVHSAEIPATTDHRLLYCIVLQFTGYCYEFTTATRHCGVASRRFEIRRAEPKI